MPNKQWGDNWFDSVKRQKNGALPKIINVRKKVVKKANRRKPKG